MTAEASAEGKERMGWGYCLIGRKLDIGDRLGSCCAVTVRPEVIFAQLTSTGLCALRDTPRLAHSVL